MASPVSPGDVIAAKYAVERVLGEGGMGVVVAARHLELGERVALKLLPASDEPPDLTARRLRREARAAARLQSKHAVRVADIGQLDDGAPFIVMEFIDGHTLAELVRRGPLPAPEAVDLILQACDAVAEAHSLGIVHRDLKPGNLMLSRLPDGSPWVYVLDFGIAKTHNVTPGLTLTRTSAVLGSPTYMSPEQIRDAHRVDARSDQWSLGVTLFELISAQTPFAAGSAASMLASIAADTPRSLADLCPDVTPGLAAVVQRCLAKDPDARFADVGALATALEPFGSGASAGAGARVTRILRAPPRADAPLPGSDARHDDETRNSQGAMTATRPAPERSAPPVAPAPARRLWPVAALLTAVALALLVRSQSASQREAAGSTAPSAAPSALASPAPSSTAPLASATAAPLSTGALAPAGSPPVLPMEAPAIASPAPSTTAPPRQTAAPGASVAAPPGAPGGPAGARPPPRAGKPAEGTGDIPDYGSRK